MVEQKRLELSTPTLPVWRSSQLSYCPAMFYNVSRTVRFCKRENKFFLFFYSHPPTLMNFSVSGSAANGCNHRSGAVY